MSGSACDKDLDLNRAPYGWVGLNRAPYGLGGLNRAPSGLDGLEGSGGFGSCALWLGWVGCSDLVSSDLFQVSTFRVCAAAGGGLRRPANHTL